MGRPLLLTLVVAVICGMSCHVSYSQEQAAQQPQVRVRLSKEHLQVLQQIIEQMSPERRQGLQELPRAQQQMVMLQLLKRAIEKQRPPIKQWLSEDIQIGHISCTRAIPRCNRAY